MILFNVNDSVRVKLTARGKQVLRAQHAELYAGYGNRAPSYTEPKEDEDGWSKWQLWALMSHFGGSTHLGIDPCFETEIQILTENG